MGFEGRIGICPTRREGQLGCGNSMCKGLAELSGGRQLTGLCQWDRSHTPLGFLFVCALDLSFLLERVFSVSGAMFLFLKVVGLESFLFPLPFPLCLSLPDTSIHGLPPPPPPHCYWLFDRNFFINFSQPSSDLQEDGGLWVKSVVLGDFCSFFRLCTLVLRDGTWRLPFVAAWPGSPWETSGEKCCLRVPVISKWPLICDSQTWDFASTSLVCLFVSFKGAKTCHLPVLFHWGADTKPSGSGDRLANFISKNCC